MMKLYHKHINQSLKQVIGKLINVRNKMKQMLGSTCRGHAVNYKNETDQYFALKKNGRWGYFELQNFWDLRQRTPHHYLTPTSMTTGYALVEYEKNKWVWVSANGVEYFR